MRAKHWMRFVLVCAATAMVAGSALAADISDAWVTAKVKMALIGSSQVGGVPIHVDTNDGRVTLSGKVGSRGEKAAAARLAAKTQGVVSIRNLLQVAPGGDARRNVDERDDRIAAAVADALERERGLANSDIKVGSVNRGVVRLTGRAASLSDHLLAMEIANGVTGTRRVVSDVRSPNHYTDREVWGDDDDRRRGSRITDGWITARTKMNLMTDAAVPASDIHVDTHRGVVTLFGTVPSLSTRNRARDIAAKVSGVEKVNDQLRVIGRERSRLDTREDGAIDKAVTGRIKGARMKGSHIDVDVKGMTVRLSGTVANRRHMHQAVSLAYRTPGVRRVVNHLELDAKSASR